jgi:hypothetical protein
MKREKNRTGRWKRRALMMLAAAAALTALLFTSPVEAGRKHQRHHKPHKHHRFYIDHGYRHAPKPLIVPGHIHRRYRSEYRPYYVGDTYFRPHGHYHAVYIFPVRTRHGIVYREYEYCRGDLFIRNHISYSGRRVSFRIGF